MQGNFRRRTVESLIDKKEKFVIDGSMSTLLERMGADIKDPLWTAKVLLERPLLVKQVHLNYFRAGADCGITCSYQATIPGFINKGLTKEQAEDVIRRSVALFLEVRQQWWDEEGAKQGREWPLCLASCGPYGAYLCDGSEYRGHYGISEKELYDFHVSRAQLLWESGADMLLFETQPSLEETLIEADIASELEAPCWISYSCCDGEHTCEGQDIAECARLLAKKPSVRVIGVNCTAPQYIEPLILRLKGACDLPIAVYPNSGKVYDPESKTWVGNGDPQVFGKNAKRWYEIGAAAVGGCCTTGPEHIHAVRGALSSI